MKWNVGEKKLWILSKIFKVEMNLCFYWNCLNILIELNIYLYITCYEFLSYRLIINSIWLQNSDKFNFVHWYWINQKLFIASSSQIGMLPHNILSNVTVTQISLFFHSVIIICIITLLSFCYSIILKNCLAFQ